MMRGLLRSDAPMLRAPLVPLNALCGQREALLRAKRASWGDLAAPRGRNSLRGGEIGPETHFVGDSESWPPRRTHLTCGFIDRPELVAERVRPRSGFRPKRAPNLPTKRVSSRLPGRCSSRSPKHLPQRKPNLGKVAPRPPFPYGKVARLRLSNGYSHTMLESRAECAESDLRFYRLSTIYSHAL